jgi:DNA-binding IclR family transcriptional regulator
MMSNETSTAVQATETSLSILEALKEGSASISQLARELAASKSTIHNHIRTLEENGYVAKTDEAQYRLGLKLFDHGEYARIQIQLYEAGVPIVDEIVEKTGEKAQLMVEEHGKGYYVYRTQGDAAISTRVGREVDLHCTSAGKAALAYMAEDRVHQIIEKHGMEKHTQNTITDFDELSEELAEIREKKVAFNEEERLKGLRAVGVPILDDAGTLLGSISVSGPTTRMNGSWYRDEIPELLEQSADVIVIQTKYNC